MRIKSYFGYVLLAVSLLTLASCSKKLHNQNKAEVIVYPSPPDSARIQFLTTIRGSGDIEKKRSKFSTLIMGKQAAIPISKPYGISMYNGRIFICDYDLKGLEILDLNNNLFIQFVPKGQGQFKVPINSFIDNNGLLYVADADRRQVVVFDKMDNYLTAFGDTGNFKPTDVFVSGDKIYVADLKNNRINIYRKGRYDLIDYIPKYQKGDSGFLYQPTNIYVANNKIYASDFGDFKIKEYTLDGEFIKSVGSYGKGLGQFVRPKGIAVDSTGNLYVVDAGFENVQIFNAEGKLLMFFGGTYKGPGDMWLPAKVYIDYNNKKYFEKYVDEAYQLNYLIFVTNQYGPDKINVYGSISPALKKK